MSTAIITGLPRRPRSRCEAPTRLERRPPEADDPTIPIRVGPAVRDEEPTAIELLDGGVPFTDRFALLRRSARLTPPEASPQLVPRPGAWREAAVAGGLLAAVAAAVLGLATG